MWPKRLCLAFCRARPPPAERTSGEPSPDQGVREAVRAGRARSCLRTTIPCWGEAWFGFLHHLEGGNRWLLGAKPFRIPHQMARSELNCPQRHSGLRFIRSFCFWCLFMRLWSPLGKRATCFFSGLNGFDQQCGVFLYLLPLPDRRVRSAPASGGGRI